MNIFKQFRNWRDRRFRERIDRVYFRHDGHGNRFIGGSLHAVYDPEAKATGGLISWGTVPKEGIPTPKSEVSG